MMDIDYSGAEEVGEREGLRWTGLVLYARDELKVIVLRRYLFKGRWLVAGTTFMGRWI